MTNGNGGAVQEWLQHLVAPAVLISVIGGSATTGWLLGRNENAASIAVIEERVVRHERSTHEMSVSKAEFDSLVTQVIELKAVADMLREEIVLLRIEVVGGQRDAARRDGRE